MPIDFPSSPSTGQIYSYQGRSWVWNGTTWDAPRGLNELGAVSVFANASARSSSVPSPTEGMVTYLNSTNTLEVNNGSSWDVVNPSSGNEVINGGFDIWQRGISFSASNSYTADRFAVDSGTVTRQFGTAGIAFSLRIAGSSNNPALRTPIELPAAGIPGKFAAGTTWTVSFYARTSTSISSNLGFYAAFTTGAYGSTVDVVSAPNIGASSTSWTRYSHTFTIGVAAGGTNNSFTLVPYLNSGAYSGSFDITGIQLEAGSVATRFKTNTPNVQSETAACYRYYYASPGDVINIGYVEGLNDFGGGFYVNFPVQMRVSPSVSLSFINLDNAINLGQGGITPMGFFQKARRSGGSWPYYNYKASFSASAEL